MCRHVDQKIFNEAGDEVQKSIVKKKRETCLLDYVRYIAKRFVTFLGQQSPCLDKLQKYSTNTQLMSAAVAQEM